jgi:hypothetical protein
MMKSAANGRPRTGPGGLGERTSVIGNLLWFDPPVQFGRRAHEGMKFK